MNPWVAYAACALAAGIGFQALNIGAKFRVAFVVAQWSALFWVGMRIVVFSAAQIIA